MALKLTFRAPYVIFSEGDKNSADLIANTFGIPKYEISKDVNPEIYDPVVYENNVVLVGLMLANPYVRKWFPYLTVNYETKTISGYDEVSEDGKYILKGQARAVPGKPTTLVMLVGGFSADDTWRAISELLSPTPLPPGVWPWPIDAVQAWFEDFASGLHLAQGGLSSTINIIKGMITNDLMPGLGGIPVLFQAITSKIDADVMPGIGGLPALFQAIKDKIDTEIIPGQSGLSAILNLIKDKIDMDIAPGISGIPALFQAIKDKIDSDVTPGLSDIKAGLGGIPGILKLAFDGASTAITDALPGMGNWILSPLLNLFQGIFTKAQGEDSPKAFLDMAASFPSITSILTKHSPLTSEEAYSDMNTFREQLDKNYKDVYYAVLAIEAMSAGQIETPGLGLLGYLSFTGASDLHKTIKMAPYTHGYLKYLEYYWNKVFSPELPGPGDIANMWSKGHLEGTLATEGILYQGWPAEYVTGFLRASYEVPGPLDLYSMLWRGLIDKTKISTYLRQLGYPDWHIDNLIALSERIPVPQDIITMAVREAFTRPELQEEFPSEFSTWMQKQGYSEIWARYYWAAHWVLVPLGQLYDMYHRGLIDEGRLKSMIKYHDYDPEWRDRLISLSWDLPGRIDLRWMFKWGKIDFDELTELLQKTGIDPAYVDRVSEAYAKNQFLTELNKLRDDKKAAFIDGFINESTLKADLEGLGYAIDFIAFMVQDAKEDRMLKYKRDLLDLYEDSYLNDIATEPAFEDFVRSVKVDAEAADLFINKAYIKKFRKVKA